MKVSRLYEQVRGDPISPSLRVMTGESSPGDVGLGRISSIRFMPFDWLAQRPHMVLWCDEILISRPAYDAMIELSGENPIRGEAYRTVISRLVDAKIVKVFDPSLYVTRELADLIAAQVERDAGRWRNPASDSKSGESVRIGDVLVCPPIMAGTYADLAIARQLDAGLLQSDISRRFCERRFGEIAASSNAEAFNGVLESLIPDANILGRYARESWKEGGWTCKNCSQEDTCKSQCVEETERNLGDVLDLRNMDEMLQVKRVATNAISEVRKAGSEEIDDILSEVRSEANKCKKRMRTTFPKIHRWLNLLTSLSVATSFFGTATGDSLVCLGGAAGAASSVVTRECLAFLRSRYQWVDFLEELEGKADKRPRRRLVADPF